MSSMIGSVRLQLFQDVQRPQEGWSGDCGITRLEKRLLRPDPGPRPTVQLQYSTLAQMYAFRYAVKC